MGGKNSYFYSIQPFWNSVARAEKEIKEEGISLCRMEWDAKKWTCIPGNGQICALVTGPESFQAVCYGVLSEKKEIPLYSAERGIFIRFSPGAFSRVFSVPACEVNPEGTSLDEILTADRLGELRDSLAGE